MSESKYPLSGDMSLIASVIGEEKARKLMISLGGMNLYIPKADTNTIKYFYYEVCYKNAKLTASMAHVSVSRVYKAVRGSDKAEETDNTEYEQQTLF